MSLSKLSICLTSQRNGIQAAYKLYHSKGTDVLYVEKELLTVLGDFWISYIHCFVTETLAVSSGQIWDRMRPVEMWAILLGRICIKRSVSTVCIVLLACEHRGTKQSSMCMYHLVVIDTWRIFGLFPHALERSVCLWYVWQLCVTPFPYLYSNKCYCLTKTIQQIGFAMHMRWPTPSKLKDKGTHIVVKGPRIGSLVQHIKSERSMARVFAEGSVRMEAFAIEKTKLCIVEEAM